MNELLSCLLENRTTVADSLRESITAHINNISDDTKSFVACEVGLNLYLAVIILSKNRNLQRNLQNEEFWRSFPISVLEICQERILSLCPKYYQLCTEILYSSSRRISISDLVHWHGISSLFKSSYVGFLGVIRSSVAEGTLYDLISLKEEIRDKMQIEKYKQLITDLSDMGQFFISSSFPLIKRIDSPVAMHFLDNMFREALDDIQETKQFNLPIDALFAIFVIFAVLLEMTLAEAEIDEELITARIEENHSYHIKFFRYTLLSRFKPIDVSKIQDELQYFDFTVEHLSLISQWTQREVNFVEPIIIEEAMDNSEV